MDSLLSIGPQKDHSSCRYCILTVDAHHNHILSLFGLLYLFILAETPHNAISFLHLISVLKLPF